MLASSYGADSHDSSARPDASKASDGCSAWSGAIASRDHAAPPAGAHALTPPADAVTTSGLPAGSSASAETTLPRTPSPSPSSLATSCDGPQRSSRVSKVWYLTVSEPLALSATT